MNEIQHVSALWDVEFKMVLHVQVNQCKQQVAWIVLFGYGEVKPWLGRMLCWLQSLCPCWTPWEMVSADVPLFWPAWSGPTCCACPILRGIRDWIGWGPGQPELVGDNPAHRGLEPDELWGAFQPKPFLILWCLCKPQPHALAHRRYTLLGMADCGYFCIT